MVPELTRQYLARRAIHYWYLEPTLGLQQRNSRKVLRRCLGVQEAHCGGPWREEGPVDNWLAPYVYFSRLTVLLAL